MRQDKDNEFDLLVRSMLEDAREEVPSGVWERCVRELDAKSRPVVVWWRRPVFALAAAAAVAVAVVTPLLLKPSVKDSALVADNIEVSTVGDIEDAPAAIPLETEEYVPQAIPSGKKAVDPVAVMKETTPEEAAPEQALSEEPAPVETAAPATETSVPEEVNTSSEKTSPVVENKEDSQWKASHADPFASVENTPARPSHRPVLAVGGQMLTNGNPASSPAFNMRKAAAKAVPTETKIEQTSKNSRYAIPVSLGVNVMFPLGGRWALGTGLEWSMMERTFTGVYTEVEAGTITRTINSDVHNTLHYIGLPINVYFKAIDKERLSIYAFAGGSVEKGIVNHSRLVGSDVTLNSGIEGVQFSIGAGFGVQFNINRTIGLYLDPSIRYWIPSSQPTSIRTQQPLSMGFEAGLRFNL